MDNKLDWWVHTNAAYKKDKADSFVSSDAKVIQCL